MLNRSIAECLATVLLATAITAQRPVVTVGGPSPDFADLPAAVAAAAPGSIVEVWPGIYTGFECQKALRVVLYGATLVPATGANYTVDVHHVIGADAFVLKGIHGTVTPGVLGAMRVSNTIAPIVVESVTMFGGLFQPALDVFNTGAVHIARSIILGDPGLQVQFANLVANESVIGSTFGPGAIVSDALFDSGRSIYLGTNQPALRVFDCDVRLSSDGTAGMFVLGSSPVMVSAFEAFDSSVAWQESRFNVVSLNGAPALQAVMSSVATDEVPMLNAGPAGLGGLATVRMTLGVPALGMIAIGTLRPTPIVLDSVGIYTDPATFGLATSGIVDPAGLGLSLSVPNDPVLRGSILCFQGIAFGATGGSVVSGPALWYFE